MLDAVDGGCGDDGLLQRFQILIYPDTTREFKGVDTDPNREAEVRVSDIFESLDSLNPISFGAIQDRPDGIPAIHFSDDAQNLFDEFRRTLENRLRSGDFEAPALESHLAKYRSLMPSLALIFQLVEWATQKASVGSVGLNAARLAADWCEYLEAHARKVYAGVIRSDVHSAHALAKKIKEDKVRDGFKVRDIYRNEWSQLTTKSRVYGALEILTDAGWVQIEQAQGDNKPSDVVRIHPQLVRQDDATV